MQWHDILRDLARQLDASSRAVKADIERDLADQGASAADIQSSLDGLDDLFAERLKRGLAAFVYALGAEHDKETMH